MSLMTALRLKSEPVEAPAPPKREPQVTGRILFGNLRVVEWDKADKDSVLRARRAFRDGLGSGMAAFEATTVQGWYGPRTEEVSTRDFNPEAEQIRMTAQYAGG